MRDSLWLVLALVAVAFTVGFGVGVGGVSRTYVSGYCAALDLPAAKVDGAWVCVDATTPVDIQP